jgi:hypothetical protein
VVVMLSWQRDGTMCCRGKVGRWRWRKDMVGTCGGDQRAVGVVVQACGGGVTKVIQTQNSNGTRH